MDADWKAIAKMTLLWKICAQLPLPSAGLRAQKYRFFFLLLLLKRTMIISDCSELSGTWMSSKVCATSGLCVWK